MRTRLHQKTDEEFARFIIHEGVEYAVCDAGFRADYLIDTESDLYQAAKKVDEIKAEWHQRAAALRWAAEAVLNDA